MHKLLLLCLIFPSFAFAADVPVQMPTLIEYAQSQWKVHNNVLYFRVPIGSFKLCFSRPLSTIVNKSDEWELVAPQLAISVIPVPLEHIQVCTDSVPVPAITWKVAINPSATDTPPTRPLKDAAMVNRWRIAVGLTCEGATISALTGGNEYHWATNSDSIRGITVCHQ